MPTPSQIENLRNGSIWLSIVSQLFTSRMNRLLAPHKMTFTQFSILNHLANREIGVGERISDISSAVEAHQPAVTKIIAKFEKLELVYKVDKPDDRRTKHIGLSQKGASTLLEIQKDIGKDLHQLFDVFEEKEMTNFISSLKKLGKYLDTNRSGLILMQIGLTNLIRNCEYVI